MTLPTASMEWQRLAVDAATERLLTELEAREQDEKAIAASLPAGQMGARRDEFLLSVGSAAGSLLHLLVTGSRSRRILELGTSYGYSTLWLAHAARAMAGRVVTIDVSADKQEQARLVLVRAGLDLFVRFRVGDAVELLRAERAEYDFVLLDVWKEAYVPCLEALLPRLRPGATIVADNMIEPPIARAEAGRYLSYAESIPDLRTVVLPLGNGLAVSRYKASPPELATLWPPDRAATAASPA
jgi:predicted O-methyltransferase YrrM